MGTRKPARPDVAGPFPREEFIAYVQRFYQMAPDHAANLWRITLEFERKAQPCDGGLFWCSVVDKTAFPVEVLIQDNSKENRPRKDRETVARTTPVGYASSSTRQSTVKTRSATMPRTARTAAKPAEPEVVEEVVEAEETEGRDYSQYVTKNITASMEDFAQWLDEVVLQPNGTSLEALGAEDPVRLVAMAGTLRMEFQKSEFNQTRRAERAAEREAARAAAASADEAEEVVEEPEKPAKPAPNATARRTAAKPAAAKATAAKPASTRRGKPVAAGTAAPY